MLLSLQYLRGTAALMIVYFHACGPIQRLTGATLPVSVSGYGVDLFFVLSGFVMWLSTFEKSISPREFMLNRLARIAPLYWSITLFVAAVALIAPNLMRSTTFDAPHLMASLAFVAWPNPRYPGFWPTVIPGWTLNYEMFFYVIFAVALLGPSWFRLAGTLAVLAGLALVGVMFHPPGVLQFYTNQIIVEFGLGVAIGSIFTSRLTVPPWLAIGSLGLGLVLAPSLSVLSNSHIIAIGFPCALIVAGLAFLERCCKVPKIRLLRHLGDASYSLYLSHPIALAALTFGLANSPTDLPWPVILASQMIVATMVGSLVHVLWERPVTTLVRAAMARGSAPRFSPRLAICDAMADLRSSAVAALFQSSNGGLRPPQGSSVPGTGNAQPDERLHRRLTSCEPSGSSQSLRSLVRSE